MVLEINKGIDHPYMRDAKLNFFSANGSLDVKKYTMPNLESKVNESLKLAMKAKDQGRMRALRAIKSAIMLRKTDGSNTEIDSQEEIKILQKLIKQRQDSLAIYEEQNREDLAEKEREEIVVIQEFLPEQMGEAELRSYLSDLIDRTGASSMKDMGKVMGIASKELAGKADGKTISTMVKQLLSEKAN